MRTLAAILLATVLLGAGACAPSAELRAARLTRYEGDYPAIFAAALATVRAQVPVAYAAPQDHMIVSCWLDRGERKHMSSMHLEKQLGRVVVWIDPGPPARVRVSEVVLTIHADGHGGRNTATERQDTADVEDLTLALHERLRRFASAAPAEAELQTKWGFVNATTLAPNDGCPGM